MKRYIDWIKQDNAALKARVADLEENNEGLREALECRKGALDQALKGIVNLKKRAEEAEKKVYELERTLDGRKRLNARFSDRKSSDSSADVNLMAANDDDLQMEEGEEGVENGTHGKG